MNRFRAFWKSALFFLRVDLFRRGIAMLLLGMAIPAVILAVAEILGGDWVDSVFLAGIMSLLLMPHSFRFCEEAWLDLKEASGRARYRYEYLRGNE